jgi:hypothetical protein
LNSLDSTVEWEVKQEIKANGTFDADDNLEVNSTIHSSDLNNSGPKNDPNGNVKCKKVYNYLSNVPKTVKHIEKEVKKYICV